MKKKRRASGLLAALAIIIAYFGLFPHPLGREIVARPAWTLALPAAESLPAGGISPSQATGSEELIPFQAGSLFGYVSRSGKLVHAERTLFRVALADGGYVNYTRLGADWVLRNPAGERLFSFRGRGYPLLSAGNGTPRVFVAKTDLTGLQEVDGSGEPLWSRDFPSMITSVSIAPGGLIAGLLNGSAEFITSRGEAAFSAASSGSRIPVVVGVAASADGTRLATVSGIDPQVLVVYTRKGGGFSETSRTGLPAEFRREVRLAFSPDSRWLAVEGEGSAGVVDPLSGRVSWTPLGGHPWPGSAAAALSGMAFLGSPRAAALLARAGSDWRLAIVSPLSRVLLRAQFRAEQASVSGTGSAVLLSLDGRLLCIETGEL